ncbi:MAG: bifunctional metallophosphatase/5'-nucleotidase [Lachnospiraceae bacterium]|nr:bifunctional metallophosphatase/5'-nucleotidase [Lachnospiraceae bacterium]
MKNRLKTITVALLSVLILGSVFSFPLWAEETTEGKNSVEIVFTHDIHSYLERHEVPGENGETENVGGMAALSTFIKEKRSENPELLLLDGGDIAMGTLYQTLYPEEALELKMLAYLGFDATTFGNHEFDYGSKALADMFYAAAQSPYKLPEYLICNIDRNADNEGTKLIFGALDATCTVKDYEIFERNGVKIAVTGVLGEEAYSDAPGCELVWLDPVESLKKTVEKIKTESDPDMIVCISHSGTSSNPDRSEDEKIAQAVPELDMILSAHSHTVIDEPIVYGDTYIVSCGCYGERTGDCIFERKEDGRWKLTSYDLVFMTEDIEDDPEVLTILDSYKDEVDEKYLKDFGFDLESVIAHNDIKFETVDDVYANHTEQRLGNFFADAYLYSANATKDGKEHPVDFAIAPSGTIRGSVPMGDITADDVFRMYSLGIGYDGKTGNPLIKIYLKGEDLYTLSEIDASIGASLKSAAKLYYSGLGVAFNPNRLLLDKTTDLYMMPDFLGDRREEIDPDRAYCVVTDLYSGQMLGSVSALSKGLIKITPLDASGKELPLDASGNYDFSSVAARDDNGEELKTWVAIAKYMESFEEDENGVRHVPAYYETTHGRKTVIDDNGLKARFSSPNKYGLMIAGILIVLVLIDVLVIVLIIKLIRWIVRKVRRRVSART